VSAGSASSLASAIFPLVGVLVGGLLAGGIQWTLARRSERRAARTAARLVRSELAEYAVQERLWIRISVFRWDWWKPPKIWPEQQSVLAGSLSDAQWDLVDAAYTAINATGGDAQDIERESLISPQTARLRSQITPEAEIHRRERLSKIEAGIAALQAFIDAESTSVASVSAASRWLAFPRNLYRQLAATSMKITARLRGPGAGKGPL
jgi:hypothetical protein